MIATSTTVQLGSGPTLNTVDSNGVVWRVDVDGFPGWEGRPASTLNPVPRVRAAGTWSGDAYTGGRGITITGSITAPTPALLSAAVDALTAAVTEGPFTLTVTQQGVPSTATVRRGGETVISRVMDRHAKYSILCWADDPRKFGAPVQGTTRLPASTGGITWPHTWPETWTATTVSGTVTLTNPGNTVGKYLIRVDGPCTGPQITHSGSGRAITFASSLALGVGEWLTIDMETRQVLANGQANRAQYLTSFGWFGFDPGVNVCGFAAAAYDPAALLTVTGYPARS